MFTFIDKRYLRDQTSTRNMTRLELIEVLLDQLESSEINVETQFGGGVNYLVNELYKGSASLFVDGIKAEFLNESEEAMWTIIDQFDEYDFVYIVLRFGMVRERIFPTSTLQKLFGILSQKKSKETETRIFRQLRAKSKKMEMERYFILLSQPKPKEKRDHNRELIGRSATVVDKLSPWHGKRGKIQDFMSDNGLFLIDIDEIRVELTRKQFQIKKFGFRHPVQVRDKTRVKVRLIKKGMRAFRL